jgi:hypothetical protein
MVRLTVSPSYALLINDIAERGENIGLSTRLLIVLSTMLHNVNSVADAIFGHLNRI